MRRSHLILSVTLALGLCAPISVAAQDEPLVLPNRDEVEPGEVYVSDIFSDWQVRCTRAPEEGVPDRCEMFQLVSEDNGNPVAEFRIAVALVANEELAATATILTPLDTLLSPGLQISIDESEPATVPYAFCRPIGCFVQLSLSAEDIQVFQDGGDAFITLFALIRDENAQIAGVPVPTVASLRGFTAAYEAVEAHMVDVRAFLESQQEAAEAAAEDAEGDGEAASE